MPRRRDGPPRGWKSHVRVQQSTEDDFNDGAGQRCIPCTRKRTMLQCIIYGSEGIHIMYNLVGWNKGDRERKRERIKEWEEEKESGLRDGKNVSLEEERKKIVSHHLFDCCGF